MKRIIILCIPALLSLCFINAQEIYIDDLETDSLLIQKNNTKSTYVYNPNGPIKTIRVNINYILKSNGTGNFNEYQDLYGNRNYNGYMYAEDLIKICNDYWSRNEPLKHYSIPPQEPVQKKVRFELNGVFFWRNTEEYERLSKYKFSRFAENEGELMNVYLINGSGSGGSTANTKVAFNILFMDRYKKFIDENNPWENEMIAATIMHEICHGLGLNHPLMTGGGTCCSDVEGYCDDGISDTPTWKELKERGFENPCCFDCPSASNNLMDYNTSKIALSYGQIARIHEVIDGDRSLCKTCSYRLSSEQIVSFNSNSNKSYIAKKVTIPSGYNIAVTNSNALFVNAEEFTLYGTIEVSKGSVFNVNITPSCNKWDN